MTSPFQLLAEEEYSQNPNTGAKSPYSSPFAELANSDEYQESFGKNAFRTALQIPQGIAEGTKEGIAGGIWHLLGQGEVNDPEELERIKAISEREGVPFDEEAYEEAGRRALGTLPTVSNIASKIEEKTGLPLEPKSKTQKALRLGSTAAKFQPGAASQKATAGIVAPLVSQGSQAVGLPEPFADILGLGVGAGTGAKTPPVDVKFGKTKPSGMPERGFEKLKEPTDVPSKKIQQINDKLEKDFRTVSDEVIKDSPIGETAENLKNDPRYKRESKELLDQAQILADETPGTIPSMNYKQALLQQSQKQIKGFALNEYKKNYLKFMKEAVENVIPENVTHGELVEQYRDNNRSLGEYFEPGASKALNRAKKDVLLDQNRAIASVLEKSSPELSKVFKEGNERWSKIMDVEAVDNFVSDMFPEGKKVDFKHMKEIFDDPNYQRIFKRSLGEEGAKAFETAIEDMLTAERPYKMMREAQSKGMGDFVLTAKSYLLSPKLGYAKAGFDALRFSYRALFNATLDKPQIGLKFTKAVENLKKGDFKAAAKGFEEVKKQVNPEVLPKEEAAPKAKSEGETINVKPEKTKTKEVSVKNEPKLLEKKENPELKNAKEKFDEAYKKLDEMPVITQANAVEAKQAIKEFDIAKERYEEMRLQEEGQEFRDRFMKKETGNEVRDLEAKRVETLKKFNGKKKESIPEYLINNAKNEIETSKKMKIYDDIKNRLENGEKVREILYEYEKKGLYKKGNPAAGTHDPNGIESKIIAIEFELNNKEQFNDKKTVKPEKAEPIKTGKTDAKNIAKEFNEKNKGSKISVSEKGKDIILNTILLPEKQRGKGAGTAFMKELTEYADKNKKDIYLTPKSYTFKAADDLRVENFYKRHGFTANKNRHKDGYPKETMMRKPQENGQIPQEINKEQTKEDYKNEIFKLKSEKAYIATQKHPRDPLKGKEFLEKQKKDLKDIEGKIKSSQDEMNEKFEPEQTYGKRPETSLSELEIAEKNFKRQDEKVKELQNKLKNRHDLSKAKQKQLEIDYRNEHQGLMIAKRYLEKQENLESFKKVQEEVRKSLSAEKVKEIKRQDISKKGLKEQKSYLLEHLEKAIEKAPDIDIEMPKKGKSLNDLQYAQHKKIKDYIIFDVPGDGEFKIKNHKKALQQFSDLVEKRWPDKPMRKSGI